MAFNRETACPPQVEVSLRAHEDSILAYGAAGGDLGEIRPLRTTANGTVLVEGVVSIDSMVSVQGEVELCGPTADKMLATQQAMARELTALVDHVVALGAMIEKGLAGALELLQSINDQQLVPKAAKRASK